MAVIEAKIIAIRNGTATIRAASAEDAAATIALRAAMAQETEFLMREPGEIRTDIEEQKGYLSKKSSSSVDLYVVAEVKSQCVGIASLDGSTLARCEHAVTLGLGVRREFWRQGLAKALVGTLLDWADSRGIVRVGLEVVETNLGAIRLYESLGFEHEGRLRCQRKHGSTYLDHFVMARVRRPPSAA